MRGTNQRLLVCLAIPVFDCISGFKNRHPILPNGDWAYAKVFTSQLKTLTWAY